MQFKREASASQISSPSLQLINGYHMIGSGLDRLSRSAVPAAMHDSGEAFDRPRCHEKTRVAVLKRLMDWIFGIVDTESAILWLYGDAGAGKSAIAQTLAEICAREGLLLASFFFSRNDPKRSTHQPLASTIALQAATSVPELRDLIEAAIVRDPTIVEKRLDIQFSSLLFEPINSLDNQSATAFQALPKLIIIDGLDECSDPQVQNHILQVVADAVAGCNQPLKVLIASRPETQIATTFTCDPLRTLSTRLALDASFKPDDDIRRLLKATFQSIKATHPLRAFIPPSWPPHEMVEDLVEKSSGQFIYASTTTKYISSPRHDPIERLRIALGVSSGESDADLPFADLDSLYRHVLASIPKEKLDCMMRILGFLILVSKDLEHVSDTTYLNFSKVADLRAFLLLPPGKVEYYLGDLSSIFHWTAFDSGELKIGRLQLAHASFSDFLLDRRRSREFHLDSSAFFEQVARICLGHMRCEGKLISGNLSLLLRVLFLTKFLL